jgi:ATP-dependent exoDNAse (exonuclease V) alpha subunit
MLSKQQQHSVDLQKQGKSISLIGGAGCGKTHTIKQVTTRNTVVVAPSAAAALNVDGVTVHSAFSLSHGIQTEKDLKRITSEMKMLFGVNSPIDRIVFDEAFTLPANLLDDVSTKLQLLRGNNLPFGGIPVTLSGDPLQCAPFWSYEEGKILNKKYLTPYIFNSKVWKKLKPEVVVLTEIFRNKNYEQQQWLNSIRSKDGDWNEAIDHINEVASHRDYNPNSDLHLCSHRESARKMNAYYYDKIKSQEYTYTATIEGKYKESEYPVEKLLKLKVGCRIIFTVNNYDEGYTNGLQGTVVKLSNSSVVVDADNGETYYVVEEEWKNEKLSSIGKGDFSKIQVGTFSQYPLRLGWATTIHSSQGLTLDNLTVDFGIDAFADGMVYVALSRLTSLDGLTLVRPVQHGDVKVSRKALQFINKHCK